jgi:hypothetical protein
VPVGDAPRLADILLLRRTSRKPPFRGLWRWLTLWNVLEYKGPTVSARVTDLDTLLELGLGIRRRLNEEQRRRSRPLADRANVSFWYMANQLGRRFRHEIGDLLGPLETLGPGTWRAIVARHPVVFVSGRNVPVEHDSLPLHLLTTEPDAKHLEMARFVVENEELWAEYGPFLTTLVGDLFEEVRRMARTKRTSFPFYENIVKNVGRKELIRQIGVKEFIDEVGVDAIVAQLTPEERRRLQQRLQAEQPRRS